MAEGRVQRRLAAILAADVVGYSRLMEQDEAGTLAMLKARRKEVLEPLIAEHQGRTFKFTGDGVLAEVSSAVKAVECAVELQRSMAAANGDQPKDRHVVLRIGVNLGDVMVEGRDLYGDGVNIAARLEQLAEPGGILVSGTTYDHVRNKVKVRFEDLGTQNVKNITEPMRVYRVADTLHEPAGTSSKASDKPSIAVLPFVNLSGDPEQQYFSDGITEDVITELSRFHSLFVIARNSSFQHRDSADVKQIARALGVQYVVEGSVRRLGGRIRVTAQLVEAATGNHLWAERYDRNVQDLFVVQDEVSQAIAATIEGRMAASGAQRSRRKPTEDLVAYDYFLQGRENRERRGDPDVAAQLLRRAIELDPGFAQAHAWLSWTYVHIFHLNLRSEMLREALDVARKAVSLDDADAWCHAVIGFAHLFESQHDLAGFHLDSAVALNSVDVRIASIRALWLAFTGRGMMLCIVSMLRCDATHSRQR
jgi:adenylate cyclase